MANTKEYLERLTLSDTFRESVIRTAVNGIQLPPGSKGLDAGCGTSLYTLMLAEATGGRGHVTGLDMEEDFLTKGRGLAAAAGMMERVSFIQGDISKLPFEDNSFDWAFGMDLVAKRIIQDGKAWGKNLYPDLVFANAASGLSGFRSPFECHFFRNRAF